MSTIYVAILTYVRPLDEIDAHLAEHAEWLKAGYRDGVFLASGRRVPRTGGIILAKAQSPAEIEERLRLDPFQKLGLATVEVLPFEPSMAAPMLEGLI